LNEILRVIAYYRRFIINCRHPKANRQPPLWPHKILTSLWLAVCRWYNKFLMHKKWRNWRNNKGLQPPILKTFCIQTTSWRLQHASIVITNGKSTGLLGHWRTWLEIHPTTWTSLQRTGKQ
jgi:hypothetical protein